VGPNIQTLLENLNGGLKTRKDWRQKQLGGKIAGVHGRGDQVVQGHWVLTTKRPTRGIPQKIPAGEGKVGGRGGNNLQMAADGCGRECGGRRRGARYVIK